MSAAYIAGWSKKYKDFNWVYSMFHADDVQVGNSIKNAGEQ